MIFLILGLSYYGILIDRKAAIVANQIKQVENEIARYKERANRVSKIRKAISIYKKKVNTIKSLKTRRREAIELIDRMTELIIPEKMWLTDFKMTRQMVTVNGIAFDQKIVADFMTRLENSPLFKKNQITLRNVVLTDIGPGQKGQRFSLHCNRAPIKNAKKPKQ